MVVLRLLAIRRRLKDLIVVLLRQFQLRKLFHIGHVRVTGPAHNRNSAFVGKAHVFTLDSLRTSLSDDGPVCLSLR